MSERRLQAWPFRNLQQVRRNLIVTLAIISFRDATDRPRQFYVMLRRRIAHQHWLMLVLWAGIVFAGRIGKGAVEQPSPTITALDTKYALAKQYSKGAGVEKDSAKAAQLLLELAQAGYAAAQTDLAAAYANGTGVPQDYAEAAKWYRQAAEQRDALAQYTLGRIYLSGRGVATNIAEAVRWLKAAAAQTNVEAMLVLGDVYLNGAGELKPDYHQAFVWFTNAVHHGRVNALNSLGFIYEHGYGLEQDLAKAIGCYRDAAEQGDSRAQMNLGRMYLEGRAAKKDNVEAYKWFTIALRNGELVARHFIFELQTQEGITESQAAEAEREAQEYVLTHRRARSIPSGSSLRADPGTAQR